MRKPFLGLPTLALLTIIGVAWFAAGAPGTVAAAEEAVSHGPDVTGILLGVSLILLIAKLGGHVFETWGMPAVLGELVGGIVLGNLTLIGWDFFEFLRHEVVLDSLAEIGIIFLLFMIGLESELR